MITPKTYIIRPVPVSQKKITLPNKVKVKARTLDIALTHTCNPQSEWAIPAFAFPAIADTHLPTPEAWKAELAWNFTKY